MWTKKLLHDGWPHCWESLRVIAQRGQALHKNMGLVYSLIKIDHSNFYPVLSLIAGILWVAVLWRRRLENRVHMFSAACHNRTALNTLYTVYSSGHVQPRPTHHQHRTYGWSPMKPLKPCFCSHLCIPGNLQFSGPQLTFVHLPFIFRYLKMLWALYLPSKITIAFVLLWFDSLSAKSS